MLDCGPMHDGGRTRKLGTIPPLGDILDFHEQEANVNCNQL